MKHLQQVGTNAYINNPGHMSKIASTPIYVKTPSKMPTAPAHWGLGEIGWLLVPPGKAYHQLTDHLITG